MRIIEPSVFYDPVETIDFKISKKGSTSMELLGKGKFLEYNSSELKSLLLLINWDEIIFFKNYIQAKSCQLYRNNKWIFNRRNRYY
jgi:hypothetical protein